MSPQSTDMKGATRKENMTTKSIKSSIPVSSTKKKARPAPDFSKLHQKWKNQFEMGKATAKKACTVPQEFEVTKPGTKFIRANVDHEYDGECSLELDFEGDQRELESLLQDNDHRKDTGQNAVTPKSTGKFNRNKSCSSTGRRQILGELPCDPGQKPSNHQRSRSVKKALPFKQEVVAKDINFEVDLNSLQSILNDTETKPGETGHRDTFAGQAAVKQRPSIYYVPKVNRTSVIEACTAFNNRVITKLCPQLSKEESEKQTSQAMETVPEPKPSATSDTFSTLRRLAKAPEIRSELFNKTPTVTESPFGKTTIVPSRHSVYSSYHFSPSVLNSPAVLSKKIDGLKLANTPVSQRSDSFQTVGGSTGLLHRTKSVFPSHSNSGQTESVLRPEKQSEISQSSKHQNTARRVLISDAKVQPSSVKKNTQESSKARRIPNTGAETFSEKKQVRWADIFDRTQAQSVEQDRIKRSLFSTSDEGDTDDPSKENVCPTTERHPDERPVTAISHSANHIARNQIVRSSSNVSTTLTNDNQNGHYVTDSVPSVQKDNSVSPTHFDSSVDSKTVNRSNKFGIDFSYADDGDDVIVYKRDLGQASTAIASCQDDSSQPSSEALLPISTESRQPFMSHPNRTLVKQCNRNDTRDFCSSRAHGINTGYSSLYTASLGVSYSGNATEVPDSNEPGKYSLQSKVLAAPDLQQSDRGSKAEKYVNGRTLECIQEIRGGLDDRKESKENCEYMCKDRRVHLRTAKITDDFNESKVSRLQHLTEKCCTYNSGIDKQEKQKVLCLNDNFENNTEIDNNKNQLYESKSYNICHDNGISTTNILCRRSENHEADPNRLEPNHRQDEPLSEQIDVNLKNSNAISGQGDTFAQDKCLNSGGNLHSNQHGQLKGLMRKDGKMAMHTELEDEDCHAASCQRSSSHHPVRAGAKQSAAAGASESIEKFVGRVKKSRKRQSIAELNESINESKLHLQTLNTEVNNLQKNQGTETESSQKMHEGKGNIMYQLELIRKQQEQLLSLQIQLEQQLHTQATSYEEESECTGHDNLNDRSSLNQTATATAESTQKASECNNNNKTHSSNSGIYEGRSPSSTVSTECGLFTSQHQVVGCGTLNPTGQRLLLKSQSVPVYFSSTPTAHSQTIIHSRSQTSVSSSSVASSDFEVAPFVIEETPTKFVSVLATPKRIKSDSPNSNSGIDSTIITPIRTPLALKFEAQNQAELYGSCTTTEESQSICDSLQVEHDIDSEISRTVWDRNIGPLDLSVKSTVDSNSSTQSMLMRNSSISICDSSPQTSKRNQKCSPMSSASQSAFRSVLTSKLLSHSVFQTVDSNANRDIGSLSLWANANASPYRAANRSINTQEGSVHRNTLLFTSERYHEALLDDECALYACRLQTRRMSPGAEGKGRANPVARTLCEGDDMHFIPIKDEGQHSIPKREGSAFCCYSP